MLGNLARVDTKNKIEPVLPNIIAELNTGKMITAANAIHSLVTISQAKLQLASRLTSEILKVQNYRYDTAECQNIAIGHALKNIGQIFGLLDIKTQKDVLSFTAKATSNSRPATANKARELLKKLGGF